MIAVGESYFPCRAVASFLPRDWINKEEWLILLIFILRWLALTKWTKLDSLQLWWVSSKTLSTGALTLTLMSGRLCSTIPLFGPPINANFVPIETAGLWRIDNTH